MYLFLIEPFKNVKLIGFLSEDCSVVFSLLVPPVDLHTLITLSSSFQSGTFHHIDDQ